VLQRFAMPRHVHQRGVAQLASILNLHPSIHPSIHASMRSFMHVFMHSFIGSFGGRGNSH
jgi:hypothetical protein